MVFLLPVVEVRVVLMSESACASFGASVGVCSGGDDVYRWVVMSFHPSDQMPQRSQVSGVTL